MLKIDTHVNLRLTDPNTPQIMSAISDVQSLIVNILRQDDGFDENTDLQLVLVFSRFDRSPNLLTGGENLRTLVCLQTQPHSIIHFYYIRPEGGGNCFLSTNGTDADSPGEIFWYEFQKLKPAKV